MLVVDANIVAYALFEGERTEQVRGLRAGDPDWRAPGLLPYELANTLTKLIDHRVLALDAALAALQEGLELVEILPQEQPTTRILEIAAGLHISAYDASYLAAAELLGAPLATEDRRLLRAAPQIARPLRWFGQG